MYINNFIGTEALSKLTVFVYLQRKLQRCIKHIQDKHGVTIDNGPIEDASLDSPRVIADPDLMSNPSAHEPYHDREESNQGSQFNGESNDSHESDTMKSDLTVDEAHPDSLESSNEIPPEDELFFLSKAECGCIVEECVLVGPHYHCNRCPYVTRQVSFMCDFHCWYS